MTGAPFTAVSAVVPTEPGGTEFTATLDPLWTIFGRPNGGYLLAVLGRAAIASSVHGHVLAASAHYLRPPRPGPVDIRTEVLRAGRTISQVRAELRQDGEACVEALITTGELSGGPAEPTHWDRGVPLVPSTTFADAVSTRGTGPMGPAPSILEQVDIRIDPDSTGFARGEPSGRGELWGWLALPGDEPLDPVALLYAADSLPPAPLDIAATGWVPTLELTVYVRALPAPGPVRVLHRTHLVDAGRVDEVCWIWDARGRVVAHATQLASIRFA